MSNKNTKTKLRKPLANISDFKKVVGAVLVALVLVSAAWLIYYRYDHRTTNPLPTGPIANSTNAKHYRYPGNYFTLSYPNTWTVTNNYQGNPSRPLSAYPLPLGPNKYVTGWLSTILHFLPLDDNSQGVGIVSVNVYRSVSLNNAISAATYTEMSGGDSLYSSRDVIINSSRAKFLEYTTAGTNPGTASSVNDDYIITHGSTTIDFGFTIKFSSDSPSQANSTADGIRTQDFSERLPDINNIVRSVNF